MVETGKAAFGDEGTYGVITKDDMLRLVAWTIGFAKANDHEALAVRKLVRKMTPMMAPVDLHAIAEVADKCDHPGGAWTAFASELRELANKPLFKQ